MSSTDIVDRLIGWTTDWNGQQMVDGEPPRDGLHCDIIREAAAEITALRRDKARLDFLDRCNARLNAHYGTNYGWGLILNHNVTRLMLAPPRGEMAVDLNDAVGGNAKLPSCRDAIDRQMRPADGGASR